MKGRGQRRGQEREVGKRARVDDVVAAAVAQQVPEDADSEDQRWQDAAVTGTGVQAHSRPDDPDVDTSHACDLAAIPLTER